MHGSSYIDNMNQIAFTKNGLPSLLICTQLIILIVICMPLCSTGIVKREIEANNTTKLIWQPEKITNNTSVNVTTTTTQTPEISSTKLIWQPIRITNNTSVNVTTTTTPATEISSSTTPSTTPRISRRTSTTTVKVPTHATTEKYAERISKDNVTEASAIDSQPVTNKDNLDDDAEVITFGDVDGVTTEEHRFDLSR